MGKLVCKECGYRFDRDLGSQPRKCPYCDRESVEEEKSAEELVGEVEDLLE